MKNEVKSILLAEDNMDEYINFISAVNMISPTTNVIRADDGYTLLNLLQNPLDIDAIFLDINMRFKNGLLCLKEIKSMDHLKGIPVVILSQSDFIVNIKIAYEYGATLFVRKANTVKELSVVLSTIFSNPYFLKVEQPPYDFFYIS